jgi:hypothetical protein
MTLILNLINRNHAIQVSDRRFTWWNPDGTLRLAEDHHNKAVVFKDRCVFSYTGLGTLPGGGRTDDWLMENLHQFDIGLPPGNHDQSLVFAAVADRATEAFRSPEIRRLPPSRRRHAFAGICWGRFPPALDQFEPYVIAISNFHSAAGVELAEPLDRFQIVGPRRLTDPQSSVLIWFGERVGSAERRALNAIRRLDPDRSGFAIAAIRLMAEQIRSVARQQPARRRTVGESLMAAALPWDSVRAAADDHLLLAGPPRAGHQTFLYLPDDDRSEVVYLPHYVGHAGMARGFVAGPPENFGALRAPFRGDS